METGIGMIKERDRVRYTRRRIIGKRIVGCLLAILVVQQWIG